jgi:DNA-binding MarR family transcriptional regulator
MQLHVGLPATSGLVDRLVEHGYLCRREDPSDRRQQLVSLTDAGRDVTVRFRRFSSDRLAELLVGLSRAELEALLLGLTALEREAGRSTSATHDPAPAHERTPA